MHIPKTDGNPAVLDVALPYFQVPQLNRRPEAPRLLPASLSSLLPCARQRLAAGFPPTGQHLQPPAHSHLGRGLTCSPADMQPAGPDHGGQAQTHTALFCQHWHATPKQVRERRRKQGEQSAGNIFKRSVSIHLQSLSFSWCFLPFSFCFFLYFFALSQHNSLDI